MLVQNGQSFLNNQRSQKNLEKNSSDAKSFEDMLAQSSYKKRKPVEAKKQEKPVKKEDRSYDAVDSADQRAAKQSHQAKKSLDGQREVSNKQTDESRLVKNTNHSESQVLLKNQKTLSQMNQDSALLSDSSVKNFENAENQTQVGLSLNQSEQAKKTLVKNEKSLLELQSSFDKLMSEQPVKATTNLSEVAKLQNLSQGQIKLDSSIKLEESPETLDIDLSQVASNAKVTEKAEGSKADSEQNLDMDSLFNQFMDQSQDVSARDSEVFNKELQQAELGSKVTKPENMNSIIKQARAFVDDGGGTMEIHLQPEGLGKVHLKVAVDNGQVNVEMMADNMAAKKALEEGLADIKNALEGHKLLVDTLKVEMSQDYQKDFSDLNNHMQEQANRDFAEQFLEQFQQDRESRFSGMFDGFKNFQPQSSETELTLNKRNPYAEAGKGQRLNLVA